jgi:hypothetical protein
MKSPQYKKVEGFSFAAANWLFESLQRQESSGKKNWIGCSKIFILAAEEDKAVSWRRKPYRYR